MTSSTDSINEKIRLEKYLHNSIEYYTEICNFTRFTRNLYSDVILYTPRTLVIFDYNPNNVKELTVLSKKVNIASFTWLMISESDVLSISLLKNIIVPINCQFLISFPQKNNTRVIYEIYRITRNSELLSNQFGYWSIKNGLGKLTGELYNKRTDLKGVEFKFAVHNISNDINPCTRSPRFDNGRQITQCVHFEVWKDLGRILNYTTKYVTTEDCYQNSKMGISTPMLEMIRSGDAQSGEDGYIWSSSRLLHNQFLWPIFRTKVIILTKIPSRKFSFSSYVRPFATNLWFALIGWLLLSGAIINILRIIKTNFCQNNTLSYNDFVWNLFEPFRAICCQGSVSVLKCNSIRIAYFMIYIIPVVFIQSYSGSIISSLSVPSVNIPFNNLIEFENDGSYKLGAVNNTFFQYLLMTHEKFESARQKKLVSTTLFKTYKEIFEQICSNKVTAILEWPPTTNYSIPCNVFWMDQIMTKIFSSMAIQTASPYRELLNRQIQKLINSGLNHKIIERHVSKLFQNDLRQKNYLHAKPFGFDDVLPLFAVLFGGICLSLVFLFVEKQHSEGKKLLTKFRGM